MRESSTHKGRSFESEVEDWLSRHGYRDLERNIKVRCSDDVKPYECDIHGRRFSLKMHVMQIVWLAMIVFCLYMLLHETSDVAIFSGLIITVFLIRFYKEAKGGTGYHVWVECKNLQRKVSRDHIVKVVHATNMLSEYPGADWQPESVLVFSATDFEQDALYFAKEEGVGCYRRSKRGFEQIS